MFPEHQALLSLLDAHTRIDALGESEAVDILAKRALDMVYAFCLYLSRTGRYDTNAALIELDAVFAAAGPDWEFSGFRWDSRGHGEPKRIYLVDFTDSTKTRWEIS